jgi:hypothetical protein
MEFDSRPVRDNLLPRNEASQKLYEWFGLVGCVSPKTLAKYACIGGGPPMVKFGRRVGYPERRLFEWGRARARVVSSTSDSGHAFELETR